MPFNEIWASSTKKVWYFPEFHITHSVHPDQFVLDCKLAVHYIVVQKADHFHCRGQFAHLAMKAVFKEIISIIQIFHGTFTENYEITFIYPCNIWCYLSLICARNL